MLITCYGCNCQNVDAYLVNGRQVLPDEKHLKKKKFWKCPTCRNFVGTRTIGNNDEVPSGAIATKEIREIQNKLRQEIYFILEKKQKIPNAKKMLYDWLSVKLNCQYRTATIMNKNDANKVRKLLELVKEKC